MTVGNYDLSFLAIWWQRYQNILNRLIIVLLSVYLIAFAAELTWRLIPDNSSDTPAVAANTQQSASTSSVQVDIARLQRLNLFGAPGKSAAAPKPQSSDAPKTRLNLTLTGVVASTDVKNGAAIVEHKGKQNTYGVGEKIDGTNAIISEVQVDRVLLRNGGRFETLLLDGTDSSVISRRQSSPKKVPSRPTQNRRTLGNKARNATKAIADSPAKFTDFIAIAPVREDGTLKGYRVSPGKDPTLFKEAGLISNDIITEINGLDLTDAQQSVEAINALRSADSLQLTINRKEEFLTIYLDLPESDQ